MQTVLSAVANGTLHLPEIASHCGISRRQAQLAALALKRRRLLSQAGLRGAYSVTDEGRAWLASGREPVANEGRRARTVTRGIRERAWWHLRAHQAATIKELLTTHASPDLKAPRVTLVKYLSALARAGVLTRRVPVAGGEAVWSLKRDLGPHTPVWRERSGEIWDANADRVLPVERTRPVERVNP